MFSKICIRSEALVSVFYQQILICLLSPFNFSAHETAYIKILYTETDTKYYYYKNHICIYLLHQKSKPQITDPEVTKQNGRSHVLQFLKYLHLTFLQLKIQVLSRKTSHVISDSS